MGFTLNQLMIVAQAGSALKLLPRETFLRNLEFTSIEDELEGLRFFVDRSAGANRFTPWPEEQVLVPWPMRKELADAIQNFQGLQEKYRSFGANDTEPDGVFHDVIYRGVCGTSIPPELSNGQGWPLYWSSMNCSEANAALTEAAIKVYAQCRQANPLDRRALRQFAWRIGPEEWEGKV